MAVYHPTVAEDVAAASASVLYQLVPEIVKREPEEMYGRLKVHISTAIRAYCDSLQGWGLECSEKNVATALPVLTILHTSITELRERINNIHQLAGPELRKFLDTYDFPFSTMNAILAFGRRLLKDVIDAKELVGNLCERLVIKAEKSEQGSEINRAGC
jgi:hypothetical protein